MQAKGELRCQGSCPQRVLHEQLHRLGCSSAAVAHSPLAWLASLAEENDTVTVLVAPEPAPCLAAPHAGLCLHSPSPPARVVADRLKWDPQARLRFAIGFRITCMSRL